MLDGYTKMNMGEWVMFCRDFQINLHKDKLLNAFNKVAEAHKPIEETQFSKVLDKLAVEINTANTEMMKKRLKIVK